MIYHHPQFPPWWSLMIIIVFFVPVFLLAMNIVTWIVILIGLIGTALFWGLTVEVNKDVVGLYFGLGIIRRNIRREDIAMVTQVRNRWWWGFGIRWTPHGWIWNIAGLDAVELTYHNGKMFRIGTDEPEALLEVLKVI
jgi:hypothetical protein